MSEVSQLQYAAFFIALRVSNQVFIDGSRSDFRTDAQPAGDTSQNACS
jgi:hypothetical protein